MAAIYGHRWTSSYGDNPAGMAGDTWAAGLSGLTGPQLAHGLTACVSSSNSWPPTLPEFRAACFGIPPLAAVRLDTGKADPFTRQVWQYLDVYRYRQAGADQADRLLREAYDLAREYVIRGGALPEPAAGEIGHDSDKPVGIPETREERLARLVELGVGKIVAAEHGRDA